MTAGRQAVGHPIDVSTGAMFIDSTDVTFAGLVVLAFRRHYNTAWVDDVPGPLGRGWRCGLQFELRETLEGFRYTTGQGTVYEFSLAPGATTARLPGDGLELRRRGDQVHIIGYGRRRIESEMVFVRAHKGPHWVLDHVRRNDRAKLELVRDRDGRIVVARQTRERRALRFSYDGAGRIVEIAVADFDGRPLRTQMRYRYDAAGDLVAVEDVRGVALKFEYRPDGLMRSEIRRSGTVFTFTYDGERRCIHASGQNGYHERRLEYLVRQTLVTDSHGNVERYAFNDRGQVELYQSATGLVLAYVYDDLGRLVKESLPNGGSHSHEYDELGRLASDEAPNGDRVRYDWDAEHRMIAVTDWSDRRTELHRDAHGRIVRATFGGLAWKYGYNDFGEIARIVFPDDTERRFSYDLVGNMTAMSDRRGHAWSFEYDVLGNVTRAIDPVGGSARYEYDAGGALARFVGRDGRAVAFSRAEDGRLLRETREDGTWRSVRYNSCGAPVEITDFDRRVTRFTWDTEPGLLRTMTAPDGSTFEIDYNADHLPVRRKTWDGRTYTHEWHGDLPVATVDPLGRRIEFEYDIANRLVRQTTPDGVTEMEWDDFHQIAKIVGPGGELAFERDELGQVVREIQDGIVVEREFDVNGRKSALVADGTRTEFHHMPTGHCDAVRWDGGSIEFELDALGRETVRKYGFGGWLEHTYDTEGRTQGSRYAPAYGAAVEVERVYGYDRNGVVTSVRDNLRGATSFIHTPAGVLVGVLHETGASRFFGYDANGGRKWMADVPDGGEFVRRIAAGTTSEWHAASGDQVAASLGGVGTRCRYGEPRRLNRVERPDRTIDFLYDEAGFVVRKTVHRRDHDPQVSRFEWNASGQLVAFEGADGRRFRYVYDGYGRRIRKEGPDGDTRYVWDGTDLVRMIEPERIRDLVHEPRTGQLLAIRERAGTKYVLCDHRGVPSELLDERGALAAVIQRGAYGERALEAIPGARTASADEPWGMLGQLHDEESGLYYNFYRYYDPEIGRFISPDPIEIQGGLEPYAYGSPILCTDELGLASQRFPGPYWNSDYFGGNPPTSSTVGDSRIDPAGPGDTRHWGGADVSHNGQQGTVPMHDSTMVRVYDGDPNSGGRMVFATFNGHEHVGNPDVGRQGHGALNPVTNGDSPVARGSWWHGEQWAHSVGIGNADANAALRNAKGPIVVDISRPPCGRCGPSITPLAQELANATGKDVHVRWPGQSADEAEAARAKPAAGQGC